MNCHFPEGLTHSVKINYQIECNKIQSRVRQKSHLGPLFFLFFIYDFHKVLRHCQYLSFADGEPYLIIKTTEDYMTLRQNINRLRCASKTNYFFIKKSKFISFHRNYSPIKNSFQMENSQLIGLQSVVWNFFSQSSQWK